MMTASVDENKFDYATNLSYNNHSVFTNEFLDKHQNLEEDEDISLGYHGSPAQHSSNSISSPDYMEKEQPKNLLLENTKTETAFGNEENEHKIVRDAENVNVNQEKVSTNDYYSKKTTTDDSMKITTEDTMTNKLSESEQQPTAEKVLFNYSETDLGKIKIFEQLQNWETQRCMRNAQVHELCDKTIDQMVLSVAQAKEINAQVIRFLKDRVYIYNELLQRFRTCNAHCKSNKLLNQTSTPIGESSQDEVASPYTNQYNEQTLDRTLSQNLSNTTAKEVAHFSTLGIPLIQHWPFSLLKCNESEAKGYERLSEFIETKILNGTLLNASNDYNKSSSLLLTKLKECRSRVRSVHKDTLRYWSDFQKLFKHLQEKNAAREKGLTTLKMGLSKTSSQSGSKSDAWLLERRYLNSATILHKVYQTYYMLFMQVLCDLQKYEQWRKTNLCTSIMMFATKMRETLGSIASTLGTLHSEIDPQGFQVEKANFFARNSEKQEEVESNQEKGAQIDKKKEAETDKEKETETDKEKEIESDKEKETEIDKEKETETDKEKQDDQQEVNAAVQQKNTETNQENGIEANQQNNSTDNFQNEVTVPSKSFRHLTPSETFFQTIYDLIEPTLPPASQFIIKQGHVQRYALSSGIFNKWSEGLLVLTWDRFLHMFRSHDDSNPLWSVFVPTVDIRVIEEKSTKVVEIREKKNVFAVLGRNNFYFRAFTSFELTNWTKCLELASSANNAEYHREAESIAKNADAQQLHDYSLWVQQKDNHSNIKTNN